jgi:predicted MFS family arabinose efflux permease
LVAAVLFGVSYNAVSAVQGLWNAQVFADRPSAGLAAVNTALTVGTISGPPVAGIVVHAHGYGLALGAAAAVAALAALQSPPVSRAVQS